MFKNRIRLLICWYVDFNFIHHNFIITCSSSPLESDNYHDYRMHTSIIYKRLVRISEIGVTGQPPGFKNHGVFLNQSKPKDHFLKNFCFDSHNSVVLNLIYNISIYL